MLLSGAKEILVRKSRGKSESAPQSGGRRAGHCRCAAGMNSADLTIKKCVAGCGGRSQYLFGRRVGGASGIYDEVRSFRLFSRGQTEGQSSRPWRWEIYYCRKITPDKAVCPFRKFDPSGIRDVSQNHRIIKLDGCDPALARDVRRRPIQVATQARSREPVSPSSAQHRIEASAASSAAAR